MLRLMAELNMKQIDVTHNSSEDLNASQSSFLSDKDKITVYQIPGTQYVTIMMTNEQGVLTKRNVKITDTDFSRENTLIDAIARENSMFKADNDVIDLRRKSLIFDKKNPFAN
jgi:hypothetical protein